MATSKAKTVDEYLAELEEVGKFIAGKPVDDFIAQYEKSRGGR